MSNNSKSYYKKNKEIIDKMRRAYYNKNKEKIIQRQKERNIQIMVVVDIQERNMRSYYD
jgi:hypothetical protein